MLGTVGAAAAATMTMAVPSADAATTTVWDRVARCESSGDWRINTGNGYYGGLQFSAGTWRAYGGGKYASTANKATKNEQIEVARRVLASQGPGAWPVCGPRAGLTRSSGHATSAALPRVAGSPTAATAKAKKVTPKKKAAPKKASHPVKKKVTHPRKVTVRGKSRSHVYVVHPGDTLSKIARTKRVHGGWQAIYRANRSHVHNPNVIHIGQRLTLPS